MTGIAISKIISEKAPSNYETDIGGAQGSNPPNAIETYSFKDVTHVEIITIDTLKFYKIWHTVPGNSEQTITQLSITNYNVMFSGS